MLGKRYIEVFASSTTQAESAREHRRTDGVKGHDKVVKGAGAAAAAVAEHDPNETAVIIYGMPYSVQTADVEEFFAGYAYVPGSVQLDVDGSGKPQGTGRIVFRSNADAVRALHERNRKYMGRRFVQLHFPGKKGAPFPPLPK